MLILPGRRPATLAKHVLFLAASLRLLLSVCVYACVSTKKLKNY